jgi:hypothetical protein
MSELNVRQTEMHTAEPSVPEPSTPEVDTATENLRRYKSPGDDQIPVELIQVGRGTLLSEIHKHYADLEQRIASPVESQLLYLFTKMVIRLTAVITEAHDCCQLHTKLHQTFFSLG